MIENDATLGFFFSTSDFGVEAVLKPAGSGPQDPIVGIFENPYLGAEAAGSVEFTASNPTFTTRTSDVLGVKQGDTLTINGVEYIVREPMPDGTGMVTLMLEEQ